MGDWTKGGRWTRVTIYRYGVHEELFHLCFYTEDSLRLDSPHEFDITELSGSTDAICMIYPFVVKEVFESLVEAWCKDPSDYNYADWTAVSVSWQDATIIEIETFSNSGLLIKKSSGRL